MKHAIQDLQKPFGRVLFAFTLFAALTAFASVAGAAPFVPSAASAMGREIDRQVTDRLGSNEISLCITTPVDLNNLEQANPLARQVQEELARWFIQAGYDVVEIRKGADILSEPFKGETLLTRKERLLGNRQVTSTAIIAGTYTVTPYSVRFNIRMVRTANRETLGMSTITIPIDREVAALLHNKSRGAGIAGGTPIEPTVVTLLP